MYDEDSSIDPLLAARVEELEQKIASAAEKVLAIELQLFQDLVNELVGHAEGIALTAQALARLDVATALATLAGEAGWCRPIIEETLAFEVEPLGMLYALVASGLWIVTSLYAIGYMRGHHEVNQTRFFACFAAAISAALGIAYARNLFTLFLFYEVLTFSTFPLVTHAGTEKAKQAGHYYRLMVEHVRRVLSDPGRVHPAYDPELGYELAGFVWFQGWNDMVASS